MERPKKNILVPLLLLTALCSYGAEPVMAYGRKSVGTSGAQFLKLGANARASGMAEAYSSVTDGSESIYWNPAGLDRIERHAFSFMHALYIQDISYDFASYARRCGRAGVFGAGFQYMNAGSIERTDRFGSDIGTYNPYDMAVTLGWAKMFRDIGDDDEKGKEFTVGISAKYIQSKMIETAATGAADAGLLWNPVKDYHFSVVLQNIGGTLKFKNEADSLPFNAKVGSSYKFFGSLLLSADVNFPNDDHIYAAVGTEYRKPLSKDLWFAGRAGFNSKNTNDIPGLSSIASGGSLGWRGTSLDFGWQPFGLLGNSYLMSLSVKF